MFVGRGRELEVLNKAYASGTFQMIPIYGRRRVGKTSLIHEFVKDKDNVYFFTAQRTTARENLESFSAALAMGRELADAAATAFPVYRSFADALTEVFSWARDRRITLVIDEYPYLAESYPGISSLLQTLIDQNRHDSQLFLILCGSSMSFMEEQVLGEKSPLYGRRTKQIKLDPFDVFDAASLLGKPDAIKAVELYSLVGGVPLYLEQLDSRKTVLWNVAECLLPPDALLSNEPENFLLQEVRSPAGYNAVIESLANGCVTPQEIANRTGIAPALVSQNLDRLSRLSVVRKKIPVLGKKRKVKYEIADNLFRFHYRFAVKYLTAIGAGMSAMVAGKIVSEELSTFVGPVFEEVCRQWLLRRAASGSLEMIPVEIGSWWGANPSTRKQEEIDVVMCGDGGKLLLGECKWNNAAVDASVLGKLRRRAALLDGGEEAELYLFAKSGFEQECIERSREDRRVHLVALEDMFA
ncbi:MAG TPA: ATP-binding protein [Candidatus Olsenella pullicola]|nr:ATP-binding protein [Candidatus Olsenella pullicola]